MNDIDVIKLTTIAKEITDRYKLITNLFPKDNNNILKHLSASSIHMALFMINFHDIYMDKKNNMLDEAIDKFLNSCGCDFKK